jgi:hypothetical protein
MRRPQKKEPHPFSLAAGGAALSQKTDNTLPYSEIVSPISVTDDSTVAKDASTVGARVSVDDWISWLRAVGFQPKMFLTLTYDNRYSEMPAEWVRGTWKWLVHTLNSRMGGANYRRKFKHSYFSYLMTLEYQKRGALHIHALIENPNEAIRYMQIQELWSPKFGGRYGFAWLSHVPNNKLTGLNALKAGSEDAALRYVLKYVLKDSQPIVWIKHRKMKVDHVDLRAPGAPGAIAAGGPAELHWQVIEETIEEYSQLAFGAELGPSGARE